MNITKTVAVSALIVIPLSLYGCATQPQPRYIPQYQSAIQNADSTTAIISGGESELRDLFEPLQLVFSDLKHPDLSDRIQNAYADNLYFNDTFHTYYTLDEVVGYLVGTADQVIETTTQFEEVARSENSYFVRWNMQIIVEVSGKIIETNSIGVSQIKFDSLGKVVFHQDFWDNTEGFIRHLPVVGYMVNKTLDRL